MPDDAYQASWQAVQFAPVLTAEFPGVPGGFLSDPSVSMDYAASIGLMERLYRLEAPTVRPLKEAITSATRTT